MKSGLVQLAALSVIALLGGAATALADSAAATCEVRKEGDTRKGASGPCTFSQRQGHISLDLRNGDSYSLVPAGKEGQYQDQKGNKVVRTVTGGDTESYKWEGGRKILLTFAPGTGSGAGGSAAPAGGAAGTPVPSLQDLVGARVGDGAMALQRRGYTALGAGKGGSAAYTYWRHNKNGQCVLVRTNDGRYASIAYATFFDCRQAAGAGSGGSAVERRDEFGTVCGVIVKGGNCRYRCTATDVYSGSQKVRTMLRYPDQTIELTWLPGNRAGLRFEGMVPKTVRHSTSGGETRFVFEGKTYLYYSDKNAARMELQQFRD
jgi:hypothetical protein